jgi:hypothetical protein
MSIDVRRALNGALAGILGSAYLLATATMTRAGCTPALSQQILGAERIVDSLRPDKAGNMQVFAIDGSRFTSDEAAWMKETLRSILQSCRRGDEAAATAALHDLTELLHAHHSAL